MLEAKYYLLRLENYCLRPINKRDIKIDIHTLLIYYFFLLLTVLNFMDVDKAYDLKLIY